MSEQRNIIVVSKNSQILGCFGSLTEICRIYGFSYHYLKRQKFPIKYKEFDLQRFQFRKDYSQEEK
jgi:hypothetical protein